MSGKVLMEKKISWQLPETAAEPFYDYSIQDLRETALRESDVKSTPARDLLLFSKSKESRPIVNHNSFNLISIRFPEEQHQDLEET